MAEYHKNFGYTTTAEIESRMLVEWPDHRPATCRFTCFDPSYLNSSRYAEDLGIKDDSFSRQMWQFFAEPDTVHAPVTRPDAYVVTADSAIPVAASIRSFYRTLGKELPHITYVDADRSIARDYFERNIIDDAEINRLSAELSDAHHVAVVDQFVHTGRTIACAASLLHHAGVEHISGVRGRWYAHFNNDHVDRSTVRSHDDAFMKTIGEMAAMHSYSEGGS